MEKKQVSQHYWILIDSYFQVLKCGSINNLSKGILELGKYID